MIELMPEDERTMTREEAVEILKSTLAYDSDFAEAKQMAIEALEEETLQNLTKPNKSDLISRQAAIDAVTGAIWHYPNECYKNLNVYEVAEALISDAIKSLPSAQPFTAEQIQIMQELESAQVEKAYELGKADRPTAHWKDGKWCSNCGEGIPTYVWDGGVSKKEVHFCIRCGARMESEEE